MEISSHLLLESALIPSTKQESHFYKFYFNLPDDTLPKEAIRQAAEHGKLTLTCTVSYDTHKKIGKGQWSLSAAEELYSSATTVLKESKHRIALLRILGGMKAIEAANPEATMDIPIFGDHKKALQDALQNTPPGLKLAAKDNYDISLEIRDTRQRLHPNLQPIFSPSNEEQSPLPELSIPLISSLRIEQAMGSSHHLAMLAQVHSPDTHIISAVSEGSLIYQNIAKVTRDMLHYDDLKRKLLKDNQWTDNHFDSVAWNLYEKAIQAIPRSHRITITKITHQLWITN
jgi:hypothetical protein